MRRKYYPVFALVVTLLSLLLAGCSGNNDISIGGGSNLAPIADAGTDQNVTTGSVVTLNGSGSLDANGDTLAYSWFLTSTPASSTAALSGATTVNPMFTADKDGSYVVQLIVNDGKSDSAVDTVTITASTGESAPVAHAGPDQNIKTGSVVTLNGSGSSDANGDTLTYSWSFSSIPESSTAALSGATTVNPTFTADKDGVYVVQLIVNDGKADSAPDTVTITASVMNSTPVAVAGPDQNVSTGSLVTLDGSGSSDADGDPLTYSWSFTSKPATSTAVLTGATTTNPTFTANKDGSYVIRLIVNDGTVSSTADTVTIFAATVNSAPVANAGSDQNVPVGKSLHMNGSGSDANGDALTYSWSFVSVAQGSALTNSSITWPTWSNSSFTPDVDGSYILQLIVNDGKVNSAPDTVTITASITANAGNDRNLYTGSATTLDGTGSSGSIAKTLSYSWSFTMKPEGSTAALSDTTAVMPSFTADLDGPYVVSLTVSDGTVTSAAATVTVTAAPLSYTDNGDSTVTDSLTGLMWHRGVSKSTGNWYVASGTYHATYNSSTASTCGLITAGSYTDWRLPTKKELISIVDHGASYPAFDSTYFPISGYDSYYASFFWTATDYEGWADVVYPSGGSEDSFSKTDNSYYHYVRCVRGALPAPGFTDNSNGTVTENNTGLLWQKCSAGKNVDSTCSGTATYLDWRNALDYCDSLELGGYTNWRLPNIKELALAAIDQLVIFRTYFPNTVSGHYWSSTSDSPSEAWIMNFQNGRRTTGEKDNIYGGGYVRCVR